MISPRDSSSPRVQLRSDLRRAPAYQANEEELFASYGGLIEVSDNHVRLLLDEADHARDLVESEIAEALVAAREMKAKATDQTELAEAQRLIDRHAVRLEVAKIRRKPRG